MTEHPWVARARRAGDRLTVFAHRGGAGLAPENTRGAFAAGGGAGRRWLRAGRPAVEGRRGGRHPRRHARSHHRRGWAGRCTDRRRAGRASTPVSASAPRRGFPWRGRGEGVPRLADVLADHPALPFIIEVKGDDPAVARAAAAVVARAGALDRVCFGGFADVTLAAVRAAQPAACTSAATEEIRRALYKSYVWWPPGRVAVSGLPGARESPTAARGSCRRASSAWLAAAAACCTCGR